MEGFSVFLILLVIITSLMLSCRWYFVRIQLYSEWVAERQRIQRSAADQNGIMIFTIERESGITGSQQRDIKKDDLPCYEDALKLPKPDKLDKSEAPPQVFATTTV